MVFYTLIYIENDITFRYLFTTQEKRTNYINQHNITNYELGEINTANE